MKSIFVSLLIALFAVTLMTDADAKRRLGGGKSTGMQRESVQKDAGTAPKPAQPAQATPATPAASPMAAPPAKPGLSRWLGPLAGLAAGGLLASLFMGGGFSGIKLMDILLFAGLAFGAFMLFRMFMQKKAAADAAGNGNGNGSQFSGNFGGGGFNTPSPAPSPSLAFSPSPAANNGRIVAPVIGSGLASGNATMAEIETVSANPRIPADFDVAPFERNAHASFIRLQAANDAKDLNDIRDFTTPEMYAELSLQIQERSASEGVGVGQQRTEVVTIAVHVLEVTTENQRAVASVRYTGTIREEAGAPPEAFDEVWHVVKNLDDAKSTWRLAGIQQLA